MPEAATHIECDIAGGCGSSDGMMINEDGWRTCFVCEKREGPPKGGRIAASEAQVAKTVVKDGLSFKPLAMRFFENKDRCLALDTMRKFDYGEGRDSRGKWTHITNVRDGSDDVVAQKMRYNGKRFVQIGEPPKDPCFWGQHLFSGGKRVVITEGEFDAMSVYEAMGSRWPAVSLPNGSGSVSKVFKAQLKWLAKFEEVVLMFDEDDAGRKATKKAVALLPPGRAKVAKLPLKDANEMWKAGMRDELKTSVFEAQSQRPDEILGSVGIWSRFTEVLDNCYIPFPWSGLQNMWRGWRGGEITLIGAGSGVGKTTMVKTLCGSAIEQGDKVGGIFLEESVRRTAQGFLTYFIGQPIHTAMQGNYGEMSKSLQKSCDVTWHEKIDGNLELYDHFGSMCPDELVSHLRYMAVGLGCKTLVLDHITMLANSAEEGGERLLLDSTFQKLRSLVEETGVRLMVISHLNRPKGVPYEEGAQVHLGSFRGSTQLACLSDNVLAFERNQQHPRNKDFVRVRSLKCRLTGDTGVACWLKYDKDTGLLVECEEPAGGIGKPKEGDEHGFTAREEAY